MAAGYRVLPEDLKREIDSLDAVPFVFGAVRAFSPEWESETKKRLDLIDVSDGMAQGLPPVNVGRWSRWNITGWTKVWRELPKVPQTFTHQVPNYRGNGYHDITQTRDVWQKSRWFGEQLEAQLSRDVRSHDASVGIVRKVIEGPFSEEREHEFRYLASLSREWFGQVRLLRIGDNGVPEIPNEALSWEPLPPGSLEEIREYVQRRYGGDITNREIEIMIDRFEKVELLEPSKRLIGTSGLQRYVGYQFGPGFVAFENARVGNALYVLRGDWEELSQLSRTELLASRQGEFDRIIHTPRWYDRLRVLVHDYRHNERN